MPNDPSQIHVTNRNVQIGNICSQFAHLELLLAQAVWAALDVDEETGLVITGSLNIEARVKMAIGLCEKRGKSPEVIAQLKHVQKALQSEKIIERRNKAIHGNRFPCPDDPAAEMVTIHRGKDAGKKIKRPDSELSQLGQEIAGLHKPLLAAMQSAGMTY